MDIIAEQKLSFSERFVRKLEFKLPIDFSRNKNDNCSFFTEDFKTKGLRSIILINFCGLLRTFKISLKKKKSTGAELSCKLSPVCNLNHEELIFQIFAKCMFFPFPFYNIYSVFKKFCSLTIALF